MKVVVLVRSLALAGAERQAALVSRGLAARGHDVTLVLLRDDGGLGRPLRDAGVNVVALDGNGVRGAVRTVGRLARLLLRRRPDAIYGFMDGPNVLVSTLGWLVPRAVRAAGVRAIDLDQRVPWTSRLLYALEPWVTRGSSVVIVNSEAGKADLLRRHFPARRLHVVANGIDVDVHRRDRSARIAMRAELGAAADDLVIGRVGRLHAVKGNEYLLDALALLRDRGRPFVAVFVGDGELGAPLRRRAARLGLEEHVRWISPRPELSGLYSAFDVLVSCSISEGMPNVVVEAMAYEVPCVVTDVGDSAAIVGTTGAVVPPGNARALADALQALARDLDDPARGRMARRRVIDCYAVDRMVTETETLLGRSA